MLSKLDTILQHLLGRRYLKKADTINGWSYRLFSDNWIEAYRDISNSGSTHYIWTTTPFTMSNNKYGVSISPTYDWKILSQYGIGSNGGYSDGRSTTEFCISYTTGQDDTITFSVKLEGYIA